MPFKTSRLLRQGRPRSPARRGMSPMSGSNTVHCSSIRSIGCCILLAHAAYYPFMRSLVRRRLRQFSAHTFSSRTRSGQPASQKTSPHALCPPCPLSPPTPSVSRRVEWARRPSEMLARYSCLHRAHSRGVDAVTCSMPTKGWRYPLPDCSVHSYTPTGSDRDMTFADLRPVKRAATTAVGRHLSVCILDAASIPLPHREPATRERQYGRAVGHPQGRFGHEPHGESQGLAARLERQSGRVWLHDSSPAEPKPCRVCIIGCMGAQQRIGGRLLTLDILP
jgi:hypothetical protein